MNGAKALGILAVAFLVFFLIFVVVSRSDGTGYGTPTCLVNDPCPSKTPFPPSDGY